MKGNFEHDGIHVGSLKTVLEIEFLRALERYASCASFGSFGFNVKVAPLEGEIPDQNWVKGAKEPRGTAIRP